MSLIPTLLQWATGPHDVGYDEDDDNGDNDDDYDDVEKYDGEDCLEDEPYSSPMVNRSPSGFHRARRALGPVGAWAAAGTWKARLGRRTVYGAVGRAGPPSLPAPSHHCSFT